MTTFDAPNREQTCSRRERSNTPLQALDLMNDVQYFEAARHLAQRAMHESSSDPAERLVWLYRTVLSRRPTDGEVSLVRNAWQKHLVKYRSNPEAAQQAVHYGDSKADGSLDAAELAAWTMVANLLLNLDETVTKN